MSKLTKREYRNIAKRPGQRGPGFTQRREHEDSEWDTVEAQQEAVRPDAEAEDVVEDLELGGQDDGISGPGPEEDLGFTSEELAKGVAALTAEEILTDLGEQEKAAEIEEVEEILAEDEIPVPASIKGFEKPMGFQGSTIDEKGVNK